MRRQKRVHLSMSTPFLIAMILQRLSSENGPGWRELKFKIFLRKHPGFFAILLSSLPKTYFLFSLTFQKLSHQTEKKNKYGDELALYTLCQNVAILFTLNLDSWLSADIQKCRNKWIGTSAQGPSILRTTTEEAHPTFYMSTPGSRWHRTRPHSKTVKGKSCKARTESRKG